MSFMEQLTALLHRNRIAVFIIVVVVVVGTIGLVVYSEIANNREQQVLMAIEEIQELYEGFDDEEGEEEEAPMDEIFVVIDETIRKYPRQQVVARAYFIRAEIYRQRKEWLSAAADYTRIADRYPRSHLAPIGLYNAAAVLEESGDNQAAIEAWVRIVEEFEIKGGAERARALFSLGRLHEALDDEQTAIEYYNRLVEFHGQSGWTNLARNRIIYLTADDQ